MERRPGFWWSPDGKRIAFTEVEATVDGDTEKDQNDPFACRPNVKLRLGIVPAAGGDVTWLQLHPAVTEVDEEEYLARVMWLPDGYLSAEVRNYAQTKVTLLKFDPNTGIRENVLSEASKNLHNCFTPLQKRAGKLPGGFIWASERSGCRHLYLYDAAVQCLGPLTGGDWTVEQVAEVDETAEIVYFMGTLSNPLATHLFSTHLFPDFSIPVQNPKKLMEVVGQHSVVLHRQMQRFLDIHDNVDNPVRVLPCSLDKGVLQGPSDEQLSQIHPAGNLQLESPQSDESPPVENGELVEIDDRQVQPSGEGLMHLDSTLLDDLCSQCTLLVQQRLSRLSLSGNLGDSEHHLPSRTLPGALLTSPSEVLKAILPSTVCSWADTTTADKDFSGIVGRHEKPRRWSEEQSSSSEADEADEEPALLGDYQTCESQSSPTHSDRGLLAKIRVPEPVLERHTFPRENFHFAWANASLTDSRQGGQNGLASSPLQRHKEEDTVPAQLEPASPVPSKGSKEEDAPAQPESPSPVALKEGPKLQPSRMEKEARRMNLVERKKDFYCIENIRGRSVNVVGGLELHKNVFSKAEQEKLIDFVYEFQQEGRKGRLRGRTYTEPRKWMPGKGRVTMQFGCCYNYAVDSNGNPPGIIHDELVDPLPPLLKATIRHLIKFHVLPESCVPDSCIINIYDVGDCIPPHIDHHDFVRPFCTLSLLSECSILFGSKLKIVGDGLFNGPLSIPLPVGSVLVLKGNGADTAKHAVPGVPTKRISITFRKMNPLRVPQGYDLPKDLRGIKALSLS